VLLYPVYALLFADAGLDTARISSLFVIWSVVAFVFEVPSGALADAWSRRRLYAAGAFLTALGYALWILWPAYPGFALGFVLWGLGDALCSGTLEALVYDELDARGLAADYARVTGRAGTVAILAMLAATLLAAPAYAAGGYRLVGFASVAVTTLGGLLALRLPETTGTAESTEPYLRTLRDGLREAVRDRHIAWAVAVAALVPGFTALDEYLPLLARDHGAPTTAVPLLFALTALAMAAGSALAARHAELGSRSLAAVVTAAAALLAAGALTRQPAGMVAAAAAFGLLQFAMVLVETRLQHAITGRARSTVLSVAGFASEVFAVALYAFFGLDVSLPVLFALCGVPLAMTAMIILRN
jgi:predicted MFS family arabinose efflux permease